MDFYDRALSLCHENKNYLDFCLCLFVQFRENAEGNFVAEICERG
jgi:hypothetical protein